MERVEDKVKNILAYSIDGKIIEFEASYTSSFADKQAENDHNIYYTEFEEYGNVSLLHGGHPVRAYQFSDVFASIRGLCTTTVLFQETSLMGVNPDYSGNKFENNTKSDFAVFLKKIKYPSEHKTPAVFCINLWDNNYQHFFIETLPRIWLAAKEFPNLPLIVQDREFIREITACIFPDTMFIYLKEDDAVFLKTSYFISPISKNYGEITKLQISAYQDIRCRFGKLKRHDVYCLAERQKYKQILYLSRKNADSNSGKYRYMINEEDFLEKLNVSQPLIVDYYEDKSLSYKISSVNSCGIYITPIGANLMNFIFSQHEINIFVIAHPVVNNVRWFTKFFKSICSTIHIMPITQTWFDEEKYNKEQRNFPYFIKIDESVRYIVDYLSAQKSA